MEQLNAQQLMEIAKQLKVIARAINNFQIDNWGDLTREQFNSLNKTERDILLSVQDILAQSVIVLAENSTSLIQSVTDLSNKIDHKLKQINNINKAIKIATASVFLVSAIISQNPAAITMSIQGVVDSLDE
ncbi:MAG: hypothetical protein N4A74_19730 [Carboxylicivirga sp.]|jgi:hypothetical protein|nr:hypothetical protein [Carboxylicivirga sp.]